jgi:flagellar biosynthetic protein FlhB
MAEGGSEEDESQKTEDPTQKRIDDAREKGQVAFSREVMNFIILVVLCAIIMWIAPYVMREFREVMIPFVAMPHDLTVGSGGLWLILKDLLIDLALIMMIPLGLTIVLVLAAGAAQTQLNFSVQRITPKFEKISPLKGFKRLFSLKNVVEFLKGIIKISIVGLIGFTVVSAYLDYLRLMPAYDMYEMLAFLAMMATRIVIAVTLVMLLIAMLDYAYQRYEYMKTLRMTKQEVKDEYKQQEGDPKIKAKLRQIRSERSKKRMMANVPEADVVITNPTHYAIALQYDALTMSAPVVVAKGKDKVALKIKEMAEDHKIPVFRNPPVARALFDHAELDAEIPLAYYEAVAKIIGYVYKMKGKMPKRRQG